MKDKPLSIDVCFLIASSAKKSYQKLSETYAAIEPPVWSSLIANYLIKKGFNAEILDAEAEIVADADREAVAFTTFPAEENGPDENGAPEKLMCLLLYITVVN